MILAKPDQASSTPKQDQDTVPLKEEVYAIRYLFGQFWSLIGNNLQFASMASMIVVLLGRVQGLAVCGDIIAYNYLPGALLAIAIGAWLDGADKKKVLMWTSWLGAIQAIVFAYVARDGGTHVSVLEIRVLCIIGGFITAVDAVNRNSIMAPMLLDRSNYQRVGTIFTSLYNFAMIFGGGLAAAAVSHLGYSGSYALNAASFLVLIAMLKWIKLPGEVPTKHAEAGIGKIKRAKVRICEGISLCWKEKGLRLSIMLTGLMCLFGFSYNSILRVIAEEMFGGTDALYSRFMLVNGFGCLAGAIVAVAGSTRYPKHIFIGGGLISGVSMIIFSASKDPFWGTVLMGIMGFGLMSGLSTTRSAVGHIAGPEFAGRAQGVAITIFFGGMALGSSALGHFAKHMGCPLGLLICGIGVVAISAAMPFMPGASEIHRFKK